MVSYIGTPTSRVDGRAKVTGAAKYAADFNVPGLIYGSVVSSRIAKGRVRRIDATEALSVTGVVEVLTHANRPAMAHSDQDYKDDVAPDGSPFRPLYDDKVLFSGQPIALVLAQEPEIARFAASPSGSSTRPSHTRPISWPTSIRASSWVRTPSL